VDVEEARECRELDQLLPLINRETLAALRESGELPHERCASAKEEAYMLLVELSL